MIIIVGFKDSEVDLNGNDTVESRRVNYITFIIRASKKNKR
jgi:hypothetical protein